MAAANVIQQKVTHSFAGHPASDYILGLFEPNDWLCVTLIRGKNGNSDHTVINWFNTAEVVAGEEFLQRLDRKNKEGFSIYVCMNPLTPGVEVRSKEKVTTIRTAYVDADRDGDAVLGKIKASTNVPTANVIVETSPHKYQVIWQIKGVSPDAQEALLGALVAEFNTDKSVTDCCRLLRLPGFANCKYDERPFAQMLEQSFNPFPYQRADFKLTAAPETERDSFVAPDAVYEGEGRNSMLFRSTCSMRSKNHSEKAIRAAIAIENQEKCKPPLGSDELNNLINSALRKEYRKRDAERRTVQPAPPPAKATVGAMEWDSLDTEDTILRNQGEQIDYVVDGIIPRHRITMLYGQEKSGKSIVALDLCKHIVSGKTWLNRNVAQTPCLYIDLEDGILGSYIVWVKDVGPEKVRFITLRSENGIPTLDDPALLALCAEKQPVIVLDSLHKLFSREKGRRGSSAWQSSDYEPVLEKIRQMCVAGATIILIHHSTKSDNEQYRDSSAIGANVDFLFAVVGDEPDANGVKRIHLKGQPSRGAQPPNVHILAFPHIIECGHLCLDAGLEKEDDLARQAVAEVENNGPAESKRALLKRLKGRAETKLVGVNAAIEKGWLIQNESGEINLNSVPNFPRETLRETPSGNGAGNVSGNAYDDAVL